jgi:hypothetical protein
MIIDKINGGEETVKVYKLFLKGWGCINSVDIIKWIKRSSHKNKQ